MYNINMKFVIATWKCSSFQLIRLVYNAFTKLSSINLDSKIINYKGTLGIIREGGDIGIFITVPKVL